MNKTITAIATLAIIACFWSVEQSATADVAHPVGAQSNAISDDGSRYGMSVAEDGGMSLPEEDERVPMIKFCEGTYQCYVGGDVFHIGQTSTIGFYIKDDNATCPPTTSLEDGSEWKLIPGSCRCK